MVFCVLVFFIEICVKKFQPIIRTTLYTNFFKRFRVFETETTEKKKETTKRKCQKIGFLHAFTSWVKKLKKKIKFSEKLLRSFREKLPIIFNYWKQNFINNREFKKIDNRKNYA